VRPLLAVILASIILFSLISWYKSTYSFETDFSLGQAAYGVEGGTGIAMHGYMLLYEGDNVSVDAVVLTWLPGTRWSLSVTIRDLVSGEEFTYFQEYLIPRPLTPYFTAPRSSVYEYLVAMNISAPPGIERSYDVRLGLSGSAAPRHGIAFRSLAEALAISLLLFLLLASRRPVLESLSFKGFAGLVRWELRSIWAWVFFPATMALFSLFVVDYSSAIGGSITVIGGPVGLSGSPEYLIVYSVMAVLLSLSLIVYKWEIGFERTMDIAATSRFQRLIAKIASVIALSWAPIVVASVNVYLLWVPSALYSIPGTLLGVLALFMLQYLVILLVPMALALLAFSLVPASNVAVVVGVSGLLLLLFMREVGGPGSLDLDLAAGLMDPLRFPVKLEGAPAGWLLYEFSIPMTAAALSLLEAGLWIIGFFAVALALCLTSLARRE